MTHTPTPYAPDGRSMRERMLAGDMYIADDPDLARESERALGLMHQINTMDPTDGPGRRALLAQLLGAFGEDSEIRPPFRVDYGSQTFVGARTFANYGLLVLDVAPVTIGDDVQIGPNVQLLTPIHPIEPGPRRDKWEAAKPIVIGATSGSAAASSSAPASASGRTPWWGPAPS